MISVSIHTNKMQEVEAKKFNVNLKRMEYRRYMTPYDFKTFVGYYQKPQDTMIDWAMEQWNIAIRKGLKCFIRVYKIESFSPYESQLLYEHW